MKYHHTDDDRFAIFGNLMADITARLYGNRNSSEGYQSVVENAVAHMPIVKDGPAFAHSTLPDLNTMYSESPEGVRTYNRLISDLLWRAELYRRGETFVSHTKGIDAISWRILAVAGAALADFEEGSDLTTYIDEIDLRETLDKGEQATRSDVLHVLNLQRSCGSKNQEFAVTNPRPNNIEQIISMHEFGRHIAQAGFINEDRHLIMRVENTHLTIYRSVPEAAALGMVGQSLSVLVEHPLFADLEMTISRVNSGPDRMSMTLTGNPMRSLKWSVFTERKSLQP